MKGSIVKSGRPYIDVDADIVAQTIAELNVDIVAQTIGDLGIDIASQSVGDIDIDIAAQSMGNLDVNLNAQTADVDVNLNAQFADVDVNINAQLAAINIDTEAADNIVIDQLKQSAYRERRSTLANDNSVVAPNAPPGTYTCQTYVGKFFPRGCRGKLEQIQIYCKDAGVDHITLRYSPHPCLGPIGEVDITPLAGWSWVSADIEEMWDYDSLFIWVVECEVGTDWGYEVAVPYDGHQSTDAGATWADINRRPFIRAVYSGETVGDIPISGIVNNVPLPYTSSEEVLGEETLTSIIPVTIVEIEGAGYTDMILLQNGSVGVDGGEGILFEIICDDRRAMYGGFVKWHEVGYTINTPLVTELQHTVDGKCVVLITKKFEFRRSLVVRAGTTATTVNAHAKVFPTLLR